MPETYIASQAVFMHKLTDERYMAYVNESLHEYILWQARLELMSGKCLCFQVWPLPNQQIDGASVMIQVAFRVWEVLEAPHYYVPQVMNYADAPLTRVVTDAVTELKLRFHRKVNSIFPKRKAK